MSYAHCTLHNLVEVQRLALAMGLNGLLMRIMLTGVLVSAFVAAVIAQPKPNCPDQCGDVNIPFPFGLNKDCYLNEDFLITCNHSFNPPKPFLRESNIEVTNIAIDGQLHILSGFSQDCHRNESDIGWWYLSLSKFTISKNGNIFVVVGCDSYAYLNGKRDGKRYSAGCMSICDYPEFVDDESCSGSGCCQMEIPSGLYYANISARSFYNHEYVHHFNPCTYAFVVETGKFNFSRANLININEEFPVVLDWEIDNSTGPESVCQGNATSYQLDGILGYRCRCKHGYEGNPYLPYPYGCQDVDECKGENICTENSCNNFNGGYNCTCPKGYQGDGKKDGHGCVRIGDNELVFIKIIIGVCISFIGVLVTSSWLFLVLKQRKLVKLKEEFFRRNGGIILQQKLSRREGNCETAKIFTTKELEVATNNYDETVIIGKGGYGTVYKGTLTDGRVVAIKKSTTVDATQIEQFVNEVVVLSQINHRNVVRLVGCCLETEVPLLVYEFINNGTLFEYIHKVSYESALPWGIRLRIAAETAGALSYLHSAASVPVIHRDIKTTNILLDDKYTAKVSDFGASRLVPLDEDQLSTMVQGTLGYLDPEYLQTSQLTEKSDVYSFGVVLVELITGRKALSFDRPEIEKNLALYFLSSLKEGKLIEILDKHIVVNQGNKEQIEEVARLAKRCLKLKGEERPTMKEVSMELEGLRMMENHPWVQQNIEETEYLLGEQSKAFGLVDGDNSIAGYDSMRNHVILSVDEAR